VAACWASPASGIFYGLFSLGMFVSVFHLVFSMKNQKQTAQNKAIF
jgi:hypothetical protein